VTAGRAGPLPRYVALSGGVGGAKFALGLSRVLRPEQLTIIANTGDVPDPAVHDQGFGMRVTVQPNGSFTVVNERNNHAKTYPARR